MSYDLETGTVLIDFWSPMCGPCRKLSPIIDEIDKDYEHVNVVKANTMIESSMATEYSIRALPTLVFLKDGEEVHREVGLVSKKDIEEILNKI